MEQKESFKLYCEAVNAVEHSDSVVAFRLFSKWDDIVANLPLELINDRTIQKDLPILKKDLCFVAFPELPLVEAQKILSSEILECMNREIDLGDLLASRYTSIPYGTQEKERVAMKEAILKNTEVIGGVSIGEWLTAFDKLFNPDTREESHVNEFMTRDSRVAGLQKNEQAILLFVLSMYDSYLSTELLNIFDLATMVQGGSSSASSVRTSQSASRLGGQSTIVRLPLLQALSKYEQLGNQLITEERLKLKSQTETVRPSLLYWIKYYRDELGVGHHSSVDRGNFLFRSENGKKLTPEERERVNLVLRSVEENVPLDIDTEQSIILFPAFVPPAPTPRPTLPPMAPQRPAFQPSGSAVFQPAPPVQPGAMSFSSKHVLPAEKAASEAPVSTPTPRPVVAPRPATPVTPVAPKRNPFHIRPVSMGKEE
jgi:hypothetical protein